MKYLKFLFLVLAAALMTACGACSSCERAAARNRRPLDGNAWIVSQLHGTNIPSTTAPTFVSFCSEDLSFACSGRGTGITGHYAQNEAEIALRFTLDPATSVPASNFAEELRTAFATATTYALDGGMLLLMHENRLLAVLQAVEE